MSIITHLLVASAVVAGIVACVCLPADVIVALTFAISAAVAVGGGFIWGFRAIGRARRRRAHRIAVLDPKPMTGETAFFLGRTDRRKDVWFCEERLRENVVITGPASGRNAMFGNLRIQAALHGLGYAFVSMAETATTASVAPLAAGRSDDALIVDLDSSRGASIAVFASLDADAALRMIFFACPEFSSADPIARRAATLVEAVVGLLAWKRDEGIISFTPATIPFSMHLHQVVEGADREKTPHLPLPQRVLLTSYLSGLPGYDRLRGNRQPASVEHAHAEIAAFAESVMRPFLSNSRLSFAVGDIGNGDIISGRRLLSIRLPSGLGLDPRATTLTRFVLGWLFEEIRSASADADLSIFPIFVDGLPEETISQIASFLRTANRRFSLVAGIIDCPHHDRGDAASDYGTRIALPGASGAPSLTGLSVCVSEIGGLPRRLTFVPSEDVVLGMEPLDTGRHIEVMRPNPADLRDDERLSEIAEVIRDPIMAAAIGESAKAARATIEAKAKGNDDPTGLADQLSVASVVHLKGLDTGCFGHLESSCVSIAALARSECRDDLTGDTDDRWMPQHPSDTDTVNDEFGLISEPSLETKDEEETTFGMLYFDVSKPAPVRRSLEVSVPDAVDTLVVIPRGTAAQSTDTSLAGVPLPCVCVRDPSEAMRHLARNAPHLAALGERLIAEAASHPYARFRPTLLVGPPGAGKSRFARHFCDALGLYALRYACGGSADGSFTGTSRQWVSARPSVPLQAVMHSKTANPCIILDEISRVADGRYNGNLIDGVLDFTDPGTARRFFDIGSEIHVNLSRVLWIATCNDISQVPQVLLDRFRKIEVPAPSVEFAPALIRSIAEEIARERGFDVQWANTYSDLEIDMIAEAWGGGSLRRLRSLMEKVTDAVDRFDPKRLN